MRIVRVDDVRLQLFHDAGKPPRGRQVHLCSRPERNELETFGRSLPELPIRVRDERGPVTERAQAIDGQQDLILSASPGSRRIDVEREHSSHSFANFRKT